MADYHSGPRTATFTNGTKKRSFALLTYPKDDDIVEEDEFFNIIIDPSSLPDGVSLGDPCQATVTIKDDDSKCSNVDDFCIHKMHFVSKS